jgi:hypothetical protein
MRASYTGVYDKIFSDMTPCLLVLTEASEEPADSFFKAGPRLRSDHSEDEGSKLL